MLREGLILMVTGMGTVFVFLIIMIITMYLMEHVMAYVNKLFPPEEEALPVAKSTQGEDKKQEIAVAIAAVKALR